MQIVETETLAETDVHSLLLSLEQGTDRFVGDLYARLAALNAVPAELQDVQASFAAAGTSALQLCLEIVFVVALVTGVFVLLNRWLEAGTARRGAWPRFLAVVAAAILAVAIGFILARLLGGSGLPLQTLRRWTVLTVAGCVVLVAVRSVLDGVAPNRIRSAFRSSVGAGARPVHRDWLGRRWHGARYDPAALARRSRPGGSDRDGLGRIPAYFLFGWAVWRHRRTMAGAVAGPRPRSRWRNRLARMWPGLLIAFIVITFLSSQTALTLGAPLPVSDVLLTGLIFVATPHLDVVIGNWARRGLESSDISFRLRQADRRPASRCVVS